jgi:methylthioribulose-1-phosphate dehydratase
MLDSSDLRQALVTTIQVIHAQGWATGTGGNFSVVERRQPLQLLMAPSGVDKGLIQPADLIRVNAQGQVLEGKGRASAETLLHLTIIEATGAGSVLHTHSIFNTLLSLHYLPQGELRLSGWEMLKGLEGIQTHDTTVAIPILPNTQDMAALSQTVRPLLEQRPYGLFLAGHGLYTWGDTLFQVRRHLEILEFLCELHYRQLTLLPR